MIFANSVHVAGTGSCLPGLPVPNERIEDVLGRLVQAPPKVLSFVDNMGPRMLERSGINSRHFAVDPETGNLTHTFASLSEVAARNALDMAGMPARDIDLLIVSCPSYDQSTPPTSALLQERLGIESCAEMEIHSNCSGMGKGVQVAFDALTNGRYRTALVCYSPLSSVYLRSATSTSPNGQGQCRTVGYWPIAAGEVSSGKPTAMVPTNHRYICGTVGGARPAGMKAAVRRDHG